MRKIFVVSTLLAIALLFAACGEQSTGNTGNASNKPANSANNSSTATSANHDTEIKKAMADLAAALAKNDAEAAAKFYSDDYHLITPQGVDQNRSARMDDMRSGSTKFDSFTYENINVRSYGDTAVAIADVKATGTAAGQKLASTIKATLVFHKGADGWKVVSGQATPVTAAPPKTEDKPPANNGK